MSEDSHSRLQSHRSPELRRLTATEQYDAARQPPMASFSLHQTTTYHWSLEDSVTACQDMGVDAIGVWRRKVEEFGTERAIDFLCESGLEISSLGWAGCFTGANGFTWNEAVEDAREAIRFAGAVGAGSVLIAAGGRGSHIWSHVNNLLVDALDDLSDVADECDMTLALQPMDAVHLSNWSFLSTIDDALEIIHRLGHPRVKLAFDAWQLRGEDDLLRRIADIAPHVALVQINDAPADPHSANDRRLPGDGEIPLFDLAQAFVEHGYRGFFEVALWSDELWQRDYHELIQDSRRRFDACCRA